MLTKSICKKKLQAQLEQIETEINECKEIKTRMENIVEASDLDPSWMPEEKLQKKINTINSALEPLKYKLNFDITMAYDKYDE